MIKYILASASLCFSIGAYSQDVSGEFNLTCTLSKTGQTATFPLDFHFKEETKSVYHDGRRALAYFREASIEFTTFFNFGDSYVKFIIDRNTGSARVFPAFGSDLLATGRCEKVAGKKF